MSTKLENIREAARAALINEGMYHASDRLVSGLERDGALDRLSAVRGALRSAIEEAATRETMTALCHLYIAEQDTP